MRKKGKRRPQPDRYRLRNIRTDHPNYPALSRENEKHAILDDHQIAAGIYQHPQSRAFQLWVSFDGNDVAWLSVQADLEAAQADLDWLVESAKKGQLSAGNPDDSGAVFEQIEQRSTFTPLNLPASDLLVIIGRIRRALKTGENTKEATIIPI